MDWSHAIERNRDALKRVLAALVAMAGVVGGNGIASPTQTDIRPTLPRHLHRAVLRLLRPAESAARRLVILAADALTLPPVRPRLRPAAPSPPHPSTNPRAVTGIVWPAGFAPTQNRRRARPLPLPLFDRLPSFRAAWVDAAKSRSGPRSVPRISQPGFSATVAPSPQRSSPPPAKPRPDDAIDAARLFARLAAVSVALDDLSRPARRFARWRARQAAERAATQAARIARVAPLKPGRPPGMSRLSGHAVHEVLRDAHALALQALDRPDTS